MLGGSSAFNSMVYLRGFPKDYDEWAEMGNPGWDYESVLETYKRMENNQVEELAKDEKYHSTSGLLKVDYFYSADQIRYIFLNASQELGYKRVADFNGRDRLGFAFTQGTVHKGERQSSARSHLIPAKDRPNLHVIRNAHVIDLEMVKERVVGVNFYSKHKRLMTAYAKKEVILSAGSINTPQILMLSGIGPKDHLQELNIKVKHDLPVGRNLQDHVIVSIFYRFDKLDGQIPQSVVLDNVYQYLKDKSGPLSGPTTIDFNGFIDTMDGKYEATSHPDIQIRHNFYERNNRELEFYLRTRGYRDDIIQQILEVNRKTTIAILYLILCNPKSVGKIELRSSNPEHKPRIYANYLTHRDDVDTLVRGLKIYSKFVETEAFKENGGQHIKFKDVCDDVPFDSTEYWECHAKYFSTTVYHPVGTAKMGPKDDREAVVDATLKVRDVEGLRVVDASIMPKLVTVNTNGPCMMIGERGSDFIREEWLGNEALEYQ